MKRCSVSFDVLADFKDGRADDSAAALVRAHLDAGCAHCRDGITWLDKMAATLVEARRVQAPDRLVERASVLFKERFRMPVRPSLLARLSFDGRPSFSPAGARGADQAAFRLSYSTDLHDVDVWEEPVGEGSWYLIGQVLPREGDNVYQPLEVILTAGSGVETSVTPDLPEFHLPAVAPGVYRMALKLADSEILIPEFTVGQSVQ